MTEPKSHAELTLQQHAEALQAWLQERGIVIVPVAQGRKSGSISPLDDFLGDGHIATYTLRQVQP